MNKVFIVKNQFGETIATEFHCPGTAFRTGMCKYRSDYNKDFGDWFYILHPKFRRGMEGLRIGRVTPGIDELFIYQRLTDAIKEANEFFGE